MWAGLSKHKGEDHTVFDGCGEVILKKQLGFWRTEQGGPYEGQRPDRVKDVFASSPSAQHGRHSAFVTNHEHTLL